MILVGWFQVTLGAGIAGLWSMLLLTGQVPEVEAGRRDIWFHIAAELATAAVLLTAGVAILRGARRTRTMAALGLGMVGYSAIASAGYYAESGDWAFVGMFAVVLGLTIAALTVVRRSAPGIPTFRDRERTARGMTSPSGQR